MKLLLALVAACGSPEDAAPDAASVSELRDLRFKFVGAADRFEANPVMVAPSNGMVSLVGARIWSPITANGQGAWQGIEFFTTPPFESVASTLVTNDASKLAADVAALPGGTIITSLDISDAGTYAMSTNAASSGRTYDAVTTGTVPTEVGVAGYVAAEAAATRVVTAIAFDGTQIDLSSYGVADDALAYETSALTATVDTIGAQASALAAGGYTITAFGITTHDHFTLVGTRIAGHTDPRDAATGAVGDAALLGQGYILVANYLDASGLPRGLFER